MSEYRLQESRSVVLDINGNASVIGLGPTVYGETWQINRISVNTTARCRFSVHRGIETTPATQIDATTRGDIATSETNLPLQSGERVSFAWVGGITAAGATGTVVIEGTRNVRGR